MADPYIGEIRMWAPTFAPRGWAFCDGQLLQIAQNQALFAIIGTTYGGDGRVTFGLPDLTGRSATHQGQGPGLSPRRLGARFGQETVALQVAEMPSHTHAAPTAGEATHVDPTGRAFGTQAVAAYAAPTAGQTLPLADAGVGTPHENMPPFLALNFIIALQGVFPPRA